jgi:hypothetical protein
VVGKSAEGAKKNLESAEKDQNHVYCSITSLQIELMHRQIYFFLSSFCLIYTAAAQSPICYAPPDITVNCGVYQPDLAWYGYASSDALCIDTITEQAVTSAFDATCIKGEIIRNFLVTTCAGLTSGCSQRITIQNEQRYFLHFPADILVTRFCDLTNDQPLVFEPGCGQILSSFSDQMNSVPDYCLKFVRNWRVVNTCNYNPDLPCVQVPNPNPNSILTDPANLNLPALRVTPYQHDDLTVPETHRSSFLSIAPSVPPTDFSIFYQADANCYEYSQSFRANDNQSPWIDTLPSTSLVLVDSTQNITTLWNDPAFLNPTAQTQDLSEGIAVFSIATNDSCNLNGPNVQPTLRYQLFLDLNNDGNTESVVVSNQNQTPGKIRINNAQTANYAGGQLVPFDTRAVANSDLYRFGIKREVVDGIVNASALFYNSTFPFNFFPLQLPPGKHQIKWFSQDGCGNETIAEQQITILSDQVSATIQSVQVAHPLVISPNPTTGMVTVSVIDEAKNWTIEVMATDGRLVQKFAFDSNSHSFQVSNTPGIYQIRCINEAGFISKMVIVQK